MNAVHLTQIPIGAVLILVAAGCGANESTNQRINESADLAISSDSLDFGTAWSTPNFRWVLPLTNVSGRPVEVTGVSTSCGCTVVDSSELNFTLLPNSKREIPLIIDLQDRPEPTLDARPFTVSVAVSTNASSSSWVLRGKVRDAFELVTPVPIVFRSVEDDNVSLHQDLEFRNRYSNGKVEVELEELDGNVEVLTADAISPLLVRLNVNPQSMVGRSTGILRLRGTSASGESVSGEWPIVRECISDLHLIPEFTHLGILHEGESKSVQFRLATRSGRLVQHAKCDVSEVTGAAVDCIIDGEKLTLTITPKVIGTLRFNLNIELELLEANTESGGEFKRAIIPVTGVVI